MRVSEEYDWKGGTTKRRWTEEGTKDESIEEEVEGREIDIDREGGWKQKEGAGAAADLI